MEKWNITVVNQTGADGHSSDKVKFMLFQVPTENIKNYSTNPWHVAIVGYPASLGPIALPVKVQFYVIDETSGSSRKTGPFDANFGETYSVTQKNGDDAPTIAPTSEVAPEGEIKVINESGNAKPLEMALFKDEKSLFSIKNVRPAEAAFLAVEPAICIAKMNDCGDSVVDGPVKEGEDFQDVVKFKLYPDKPQVTILIKQLSNGEIKFEEGSDAELNLVPDSRGTHPERPLITRICRGCSMS